MESARYRPATQATPPSRYQRDRAAARLNDPALDKREIFKQMVVSQLEAGFLRYSRRTALMNFARQIGIGEFDATLLIAEAQFYADRIEPFPFETLPPPLDPPTDVEPDGPAGTFTWRLMFAAAVALLLDLMAVYWLTA